jgi:hypothetical protein
MQRCRNMNLNLSGILIILFLFITPHSSYLAQTSISSEISMMFENLRKASNDSERLIVHNELKVLIRETLIEFDSSEYLSELLEEWPAGFATAGSGDEIVTVISWNSERQDRTQDYGAFVIYGFEDSKLFDNYKWTELIHNRHEDSRDDSRSYRVDDWPGAIYYELILNHDGKTPVYTLLGWDGADAQVTRKIMETMIISNDRIRIGVPYLNRPEGLRKRHVLEYSDELQATLLFEPDNNRIVLDRLAPSDPSLSGATAFYGPTMEYDEYVWHGGKWEFSSNISVSNSKDKERNRPYNAPGN